MEEFHFRDWTIAYARSGRGSPVVFLHNGGTSHAIWREVMPRVAERHEVFALDLLGYGASSKPGSGYVMDTYVELLGAFIDEHSLAPVTLVGNCMGSAISLTFTRRRPSDVRQLVLINPLTAATLLAGQLGPLLRVERRAPKLAGKLHALAARSPLPGWLSRQAVRFQYGPLGRASEIAEERELLSCMSTPTQIESMLAVLDDLESYRALDSFSPPPGFPPLATLWGLDNRVLSAKAGRKLNATLRPSRAEWVEGAGHLPMLEAPERVARFISELIDAPAARVPAA